jgi:hypothetical protein
MKKAGFRGGPTPPRRMMWQSPIRSISGHRVFDGIPQRITRWNRHGWQTAMTQKNVPKRLGRHCCGADRYRLTGPSRAWTIAFEAAAGRLRATGDTGHSRLLFAVDRIV